jgi:hypothetical protein
MTGVVSARTVSLFLRWYSMKVMDRETKTGILLIILGICIPLATFPYLSGYAKDKGIVENLYQAGIQIKQDNKGDTANQPATDLRKINHTTPNFTKLIPKRIPFRLFLVVTVILVYMGIVRIDASRRKKAERQERLLRTGTLD